MDERWSKLVEPNYDAMAGASGGDERDVSVRERTFSAWGSKKPSKTAMAQAGFVYKGHGVVMCFACGVQVTGWSSSDDPLRRHREQAEACPFLEGLERAQFDDSGIQNMWGSSRSSAATASARSRITSLGMSRGSWRDSDGDSALSIGSETPLVDPSAFRPAPLHYKKVEERVRSFRGSTFQPGRAESLSKAGFYYSGVGDRVKCAFCGGALKKWRARDSAIATHARYFPHCSYVKAIEKQSKVLSENIRTVQNKERLMFSADLMRQTREGSKSSRAALAERTRKALEKMQYSDSHIQRARRRLLANGYSLRELTVETYVMELQKMEKEEMRGEATHEELPTLEEEDEEEEEEEEEDELDVLSSLSIEEIALQLEKQILHVRREMEDLSKSRKCKICLEEHVDTLLLTCKHLVMCKECADKMNQCPMCRETILGTIDVITR